MLDAVGGARAAPRVLIVEDNALIALDLEDILTTSGCEVIGPKVTVRDALALLDTVKIDAAVVDYLLDDGTADPLAQALNERGIPFTICTGAVRGDIGARYPHTPILNKPYTLDDVSLVVNSLIASRLAGNMHDDASG